MKKHIGPALIIIILAIFNACSTVLNTTTQNIEIKTTPENAKITVDGKKFGTAPQMVNLDRSKDHNVKIELEGYDTYEMQITRKISTWFWFNILNGAVPGMLTDMFTGSMYNLLPEVLEVELQQAKEQEPPAKKR